MNRIDQNEAAMLGWVKDLCDEPAPKMLSQTIRDTCDMARLLLEALERIIDEVCDGGEDCNKYCTAESCVWKLASDAISKAEGRHE